MSPALLALLLAASLRAQEGRGEDEDAQECPPGTVRVATNMKVEPFKCVEADREPGGPFIRMTPTFKVKPKCPKGFEPRFTPGQLTRFRCVIKAQRPVAEPALPPSRRDPNEVLAPDPPTPPAPASFRPVREFSRYTIRGQVQFDHPKGWHLEDGWTDEVPTVYVEYDTGRQGRQVTLVISRIQKGQYGYDRLESAIAKEKEFQNAAETAPGQVGGLPARQTFVRGASRTTFVAAGPELYYTLSYGAPSDLFKTYEPAYERLLETFRVSRPGRALPIDAR